MPSLKRIRTRIASVKSTQKITRAMKLVAAARLRRAQDAMTAARPYARRLADVIADVAMRIAAAAREDAPAHPLLTRRDVKRVRLIVVTSDRGLAGGYNSNLLRTVERWLVDEGPKYERVELALIGRKAREYFKRRKAQNVVVEWPGVASDTALVRAREIAAAVTQDFVDNKVDAIYVVYNEFKSAISQRASVEPLLPVRETELGLHDARIDFEYEPSKEDVLATLLPLYVEIELYRVMLEAIASEFGARMSAMDSATKNAKEMISNLTLQFNRARQAAITKELMEIVGGAEALKG
jgi:F-type H+-transporting ATPase subunit gamma